MAKRDYVNNGWTNWAIFFAVLAGIFLVFSFIAPIIFTGNSCFTSEYIFDEKSGVIGDTIGGIMNPIIAVSGVIFTFLAFYMQIKANVQQREQFNKSLNQKLIDDKKEYYYKLILLKTDIDIIIKDITERVSLLKEFSNKIETNPFVTGKLMHSLLSHYQRALDQDRTSIFKSFMTFFSEKENWINQFNNLYTVLDYLPEAFKEIYKILDFHYEDTYQKKIIIRDELLKLENKCVETFNYNASNNFSEANKIIQDFLFKYREILMEDIEKQEETDLDDMYKIIEKFNSQVALLFNKVKYETGLDTLSSFAAGINQKINFLRQDSRLTVNQLNLFSDKIANKNQSSLLTLQNISQFLNDSLQNITIEKLNEEYLLPNT